MNRRDFLMVGLAGTTSALLGWKGNARATSTSGGTAFPTPVYRTLGRTGLKITVVSFGAMLTPEPEVMRVAFEHGVNYVDTARRYMGGRNEEIVARALKGMRNRVYVATKIRPSSGSRAEIFNDVEESLRALETDYIDVIQLHNLRSRERVFNPETREALLTLREKGKVRFFGVTTHTNQAEVLHALVEDPDRFFDMALVAFNFKSGRDVKEALDRAARANIGIVAMKTQAGGYETDAMGPISPHQAALKWVLQHEYITAAIPGMRNMAHLREDIAVMGMRLGFWDKLILRGYSAAVQNFYCNFCGKCETTCSKGVAISTINRCLMYAEAYKSIELALSTYHDIPSTASATACLDCSNCTATCTNGIDITTKMKLARTLLTQGIYAL